MSLFDIIIFIFHYVITKIEQVFFVTAQKYHVCTNAMIQDDKILQKIAADFNSALVFSPSESKMAFCIRDPLRTGLNHFH